MSKEILQDSPGKLDGTYVCVSVSQGDTPNQQVYRFGRDHAFRELTVVAMPHDLRVSSDGVMLCQGKRYRITIEELPEDSDGTGTGS